MQDSKVGRRLLKEPLPLAKEYADIVFVDTNGDLNVYFQSESGSEVSLTSIQQLDLEISLLLRRKRPQPTAPPQAEKALN
jgi:hypothetical protein